MKLTLTEDDGTYIETVKITKSDLRNDEVISWLEGAIEVHCSNSGQDESTL